MFLRCPEIEALFAETSAQAVNLCCRLQDMYENCAVPEEWKAFPPHEAVVLDEAGSDIVGALPHLPFERPTLELRVLANAKTPLEM